MRHASRSSPPGTPDQFAGCLVGQALADAIGAPCEGMRPWQCRAYLSFASPGEKLYGGLLRAGQYTDDTQLARELLLSWVECGRFDPADYARRLVRVFAEGRVVGPGLSTMNAVRNLAEGIPWQESGTPPPLMGNGSAMRAAPVGLMLAGDPETLARAAVDQGRMTHADPRASAGAVAVAGAVAIALRHEEVDAPRFAGELASLVARVSAEFGGLVERLPEWAAREPNEAAPEIAVAGLEPDTFEPGRGVPGVATASVLWSLYCFLRHPDDYLAAVLEAVAGGGDTDTTAAMTGAISGARLGLDALPPSAKQVTDRGEWGYDELVELARKAWEVREGGCAL